MHGGNRDGSRPPARRRQRLTSRKGSRGPFTQIFFNPPPGSLGPGVKVVSSPPKKKSPLQLYRSSSFPQNAARPTPTHKVLSIRNQKFKLIFFGNAIFRIPKSRPDYLKFDSIIWCANVLAH